MRIAMLQPYPDASGPVEPKAYSPERWGMVRENFFCCHHGIAPFFVGAFASSWRAGNSESEIQKRCRNGAEMVQFRHDTGLNR
jgi:hypothetical protein